MLTKTGARNLAGVLINDSSSSTLTVFDTLINQAYKEILVSMAWPFLQRSRTLPTVASQQFYNLPADYDKLVDVTVLVSNIIYHPVEAPSRDLWDQINTNTTVQSNVPMYYYIFNGQLGFYPIPSTSSNTITFNYRRKVRDLSLDDYTTGTVDVITNNATTVTGAATTWTASFIGRFLNIPPSNTATASGDGLWYEIASRASNTSIGLTLPYLGTSLTTPAGATYTIGDCMIIPEQFQILPVYRAVAVYYTSINPNSDRAQEYSSMYNSLLSVMKEEQGPKSESPVLNSSALHLTNPNDFVWY